MRKLFILFFLVLAILTTPAICGAKSFTLGIEAGYYSPIDANFTEIYGSGEVTFGVNAAYRFLKYVSIQTAYNMYNADGDTSFPGLDFTVSIKTLRIGSFFHLNLKNFIPKVGAGLAQTWVNGDSPYGSIDDAKSGWFAGTGVDIRIQRNFLTGFELLYNDVTLKGSYGAVSIGGISLLLSLKLEI